VGCARRVHPILIPRARGPALSCARAQDAADLRRSHHIAVADAHEGGSRPKGPRPGAIARRDWPARPSPACSDARVSAHACDAPFRKTTMAVTLARQSVCSRDRLDRSGEQCDGLALAHQRDGPTLLRRRRSADGASERRRLRRDGGRAAMSETSAREESPPTPPRRDRVRAERILPRQLTGRL